MDEVRTYLRVARKAVKYVLRTDRTCEVCDRERTKINRNAARGRPPANNRDRGEASKRGGSTCARKPSTVRTTAYVYNHTPRLVDLDLDPVYAQNPLCIVFRSFIFTRCYSLLFAATRGVT